MKKRKPARKSKARTFVEAASETGVIMTDTVSAIFGNPIPLASLSKSVRDWYLSVKANQFSNRLTLFLTQTQDIPREKIQMMLKDVDDDPVGLMDRLLSVLDRLDENRKAIILGKLFKAFLFKKISKEELLYLTTAVDSTLFENLQVILTAKKDRTDLKPKDKFAWTINKQLSGSGLLIEHSIQKDAVEIGYNYYLSRLGKLLRRYGQDYTEPEQPSRFPFLDE